MLKNYFLIAWRSFKRNRFLTIINILGLSIGIIASLVVFLVMDYNFSFDKFEPDGDRIYRVVTEFSGSSNYGVPVPFGAELSRIAGVTGVAPVLDFYAGNTKVVVTGGSGQALRSIKNQGSIVFTNADYFGLFPHQWVAGDPHHALDRPNQVVLTQSRAETWFPGVVPTDLMGRTIILSDSVYATVSGVVKDLEANSDFEYQAYLSLPTIEFARLTGNYGWTSWGTTSSRSQLLIKINPGVTPANIDHQLAAITAMHLTAKDDKHTVHRLQPLADIHTNTEFSGEVGKPALASLAMLAFFLLLLGCINFVNLATAQGIQRAKEIGIRKTFGGSKKQLVFQFLTETFLLTTITSLIAFSGILSILPSFLPDKLLLEHVLHLPSLVAFFICLIIVLTLLSGLYPAFILSRFQPVRVLSAARSSGSQSVTLRKVLTIVQFTIAQVFLIAVFVVNKQIHYSLEKDMGFRQQAVLNIDLPSPDSTALAKESFFCDRLKQLPGIERLSIADESPAFNGQSSTKVSFNQYHKDIQLSTDIRTGDSNYVRVYSIPLVAGRNLKTADSVQELLINETLARRMGFAHPADAVGQFLTFNGNQHPVVGVMADFNQASVRNSIHPLILYSAFLTDWTVHIALLPDHKTWQNTIAGIQKTWKEIYPDEDFSYSFVDQNIARFYRQDIALSFLLSFAAGIAIVVSCIGLLGLVIFSVSSRTKEIGIRKVLGASLSRIVAILATAFVRPLLLAFAIAIPLAWVACHLYLRNFAFHTGLSWWIFALSGGMMIAIAMVTAGFHTIRAALANPVESLRTEG